MAFSPVSSQDPAKISEVSKDDNQREAKEKRVQAVQHSIAIWNENLTQELGTQREINFL